MKKIEQEISPWSFYDEKIGVKQQKSAQHKQQRQIAELNKMLIRLDKDSLNFDADVKSLQMRSQRQKQLQKKYGKQPIVLKVAQLTEIQNSDRIQYQSKRYFQKIKTLILLKMIKRKLHHQSDNIIQNVLNIQQLANQNIHHQGIFFPKVSSKHYSGYYQQLSPQHKLKKDLNSYGHIKRSLSQNNYQLYGESIIEKLNQLNMSIDPQPELPVFQKKFSKVYHANSPLLKGNKIYKI